MSLLIGVCSDTAAHLISAGQLVEALAPLSAARIYGGNDGVEQNARVLAAQFAMRAKTALAADEMSQAILDASLGLTAQRNTVCLYIMAHGIVRTDPISAARMAEEMEDLADPGAADLRASALRLFAQALLAAPRREASRLAPTWTERLSRLVADHPSAAQVLALEAEAAPVIRALAANPTGAELPTRDQSGAILRAKLHLDALEACLANASPLEAAGHLAAALDAHSEHPRLPALRADLSLRLWSMTCEGPHASENSWLSATATICALAPNVAAQIALLESLTGRGEAATAARLGQTILAASRRGFVEWHRAAFETDRAKHLLEGVEDARAQELARVANLEPLGLALQEQPDNDSVRVIRLGYMISLSRYREAFIDLHYLIERIKGGATLDPGSMNMVLQNACILLPTILHPQTAWAAERIAKNAPNNFQSLLWAFARVTEIGASAASRLIAEKLVSFQDTFRLFGELQTYCEDLDQPPAAILGRRKPGKPLVYANMTCWGRSYIDLMSAVCLPSLAAPRNLPALAEDRDLVLELLIGPDDLENLLASPSLAALAEHCAVHVHLLPFTAQNQAWVRTNSYHVYGHSAHFTLLRARRDGADVIFMCPDYIYADGYFSALAQATAGRDLAFFADGLNAHQETMLKAMKPYYDGPRLIIPTKALAQAAGTCLMPRTRDNIFIPDAETSTYFPCRLLFFGESGVTLHSLYKLPTYVSNGILKRIDKFNYATPDGFLVDNILDHIKREEILELNSQDEILVIEVCNDDGVLFRQVERTPFQAITDLFFLFPINARRYWFFENGIDYSMPAPTGAPLIEDAERLAFLAKIRGFTQSNQAFMEIDAERDRARPDAFKGVV